MSTAHLVSSLSMIIQVVGPYKTLEGKAHPVSPLLSCEHWHVSL